MTELIAPKYCLSLDLSGVADWARGVGHGEFDKPNRSLYASSRVYISPKIYLPPQSSSSSL